MTASSPIVSPLSPYCLLLSGTPSWFSKLSLLSVLSLFCPIQSLFQLQSSHLFISVTITTTNVLTDLLALQWEVKPQRERVRASARERGRKKERQSHPPTQKPCINNCTLCSQIMWDAWFSIQPHNPLLTHTLICVCFAPLPALQFRLHCGGYEADTAIMNKLASTG